MSTSSLSSVVDSMISKFCSETIILKSRVPSRSMKKSDKPLPVLIDLEDLLFRSKDSLNF